MKDVCYIYLVICNAIVTFILEFPGTSNLNASATTLTFILAVPGTSNLNAGKKLVFCCWLFKVCRGIGVKATYTK